MTTRRKWPRAWRTVAATAGVLAVLAGSAATASATPATVRPMGIGYANSVSTPTAIRSAPTNSTFYVGTARPGDNIADICWVTDGGGAYWDLVLERTGAAGDHYGNTTGYIQEANLSDGGRDQNTQCSGPTADYVTSDVTMRSAITSGSYAVGTAINHHDDLGLYCTIQDGSGTWWDLAIDETGGAGDHLPGTAAMIQSSLIYYGLPGGQLIGFCGQS